MLRINIETPMTDDNIADVGLWYSTLYDFSIDQLASLAEYLPKFHESIDFKLRIKSRPCVICEEEEWTRNCLSYGTYCPLMPIHMKDELMQKDIEDIGGKTLMMQSLLAKIVQDTLDENTDDKKKVLT